MDNPGVFSLGDFTVTGPTTQVGTPVTDLAGMAAVAVQARFASGGGGTSCTVFLQTSFDQGQTWVDLAALAFGTASAVLLASLVGGTLAPQAPTDAGLAAGTILAGAPLGDRLQAKVVSTGTFVNSTLCSVWACVR